VAVSQARPILLMRSLQLGGQISLQEFTGEHSPTGFISWG